MGASEKMSKNLSHLLLPYYSKKERTAACQTHVVHFETAHRNDAALRAALAEVSSPGSASFRQYWSAEEVAALTVDQEDAVAIRAWAEAHGATTEVVGRVAASLRERGFEAFRFEF